eukprot:CAMPEP_0204118516 /NCGR_PEP_ID=MMETSP0361-20130328/6591_1 /ASSEMBLY_ACC=CAM_ASM_000343 /TAXON_ID=268821 /ORGANISM="Scrippsiella Hangoei, Strain SHTV-5" /LENGTH=89 /DNA_ID=CAMNT_0051069551 /DNA_START=398 /DNA_END=667 /DNA_ORIENTATION=+
MAAKQPGPEGLLDVVAATAAGLRATSPPAKEPITDVGAYLSMTPCCGNTRFPTNPVLAALMTVAPRPRSQTKRPRSMLALNCTCFCVGR